MEIVRVGEACHLGYFIDGGVGHSQKTERMVYSYTVDIINRCGADRVLEHLGEIVGAYGYHIRESFDIGLFTVVLCYVLDYGTEADNVVINHPIHLGLGGCIVAKHGSEEHIDICSYRHTEANVARHKLLVGLVHIVRQLLVNRMSIAEHNDTAEGLNVEHIIDLAVEVVHIFLDK